MLTRSQTREREELLGLQQDIFMAELNERAAKELSCRNFRKGKFHGLRKLPKKRQISSKLK